MKHSRFTEYVFSTQSLCKDKYLRGFLWIINMFSSEKKHIDSDFLTFCHAKYKAYVYEQLYHAKAWSYSVSCGNYTSDETPWTSKTSTKARAVPTEIPNNFTIYYNYVINRWTPYFHTVCSSQNRSSQMGIQIMLFFDRKIFVKQCKKTSHNIY